jgi:peptidyl-prolyl cis-trans isomerase SurA
MPPMRVCLPPLLLLLGAAPLFAAPPQAATPRTRPPAPAAAAQGAPAAPNVLRDRVVAVVDEDPILVSDIDRAIGLGLQQPKPGESDKAFRRRVLDELVGERLRFHEIDRFGVEQVPVEDVDKNVAEIRARFKSEDEFRRQLKAVGLDPQGLRQLVARQLMVLTYVDERLGARVFVGLDDINEYYRSTLAPEMKRRGQPVPPVEEVREQIREVLKQQKLVQEIDRWTNELRRQADIVVYFDQPEKPLPPVVKRIDKPAEKKPPA